MGAPLNGFCEGAVEPDGEVSSAKTNIHAGFRLIFEKSV
jgi:hypothetical protein